MEYSSFPPGFSMEMALAIISFWILPKYSGRVSSQVLATFGSFRNIPSPEQGASTKILSKNSGKYPERRPGVSFVTMEFRIPKSSRLRRSAFARELLMSLATRKPFPCSFAPRAVAFPPGAAHRSRTYSPGRISRRSAGVMALGSWR